MSDRPNFHLFFWALRSKRKVKSHFLLIFVLGNCNEEDPDTMNVIRRHSLLHLVVHKLAASFALGLQVYVVLNSSSSGITVFGGP
jgi:hypothetical protein